MTVKTGRRLTPARGPIEGCNRPGSEDGSYLFYPVLQACKGINDGYIFLSDYEGGRMKKSIFLVLVAAVLSVLLVTVVMAAESGKMETATGKVTSIDPQGKGITISAKMGGKEAMDVGTVVDKDTVVKIKEKKPSSMTSRWATP